MSGLTESFHASLSHGINHPKTKTTLTVAVSNCRREQAQQSTTKSRDSVGIRFPFETSNRSKSNPAGLVECRSKNISQSCSVPNVDASVLPTPHRLPPPTTARLVATILSANHRPRAALTAPVF